MISVGVIDPSGKSRALLEGGVEVRYVFIDPSESLTGDAADADALFVWGSGDFLKDNWHRFLSVRWIHSASAGVDRLLFPELVRSDVVLTSSRNIFDRALAEYTIGLMLAAAKDFTTTISRQAAHEWKARETESLFGKTLVVVGVGPIGRETARLAKAFGMRLIGVGRTAREDPDLGPVIASTDLASALPEADFLLLIAPRTPITEGLIGREAIALLKPSARVINVGRGSIIDQEELRRALVEGRIAGAALDVFEKEPLAKDDPMWDTPNLLVSPHMAGDYAGWRRDAADLFMENLRRWTAREPLLNVVDKALGYVPASQFR
ncbi:MAG TPA: D-2-hydroxyacid dehydrogenase [Candidatus Acidoferrum sp.]|nr:D-2-hydroxyacid dehydrogenase [Candidatus Acidoferrum sp.]